MAVQFELLCKRHPKYAAKRKPLDRLKYAPDCGCWRLWNLYNEVKKGGQKGADLLLEELNY